MARIGQVAKRFQDRMSEAQARVSMERMLTLIGGRTPNLRLQPVEINEKLRADIIMVRPATDSADPAHAAARGEGAAEEEVQLPSASRWILYLHGGAYVRGVPSRAHAIARAAAWRAFPRICFREQNEEYRV